MRIPCMYTQGSEFDAWKQYEWNEVESEKELHKEKAQH